MRGTHWLVGAVVVAVGACGRIEVDDSDTDAGSPQADAQLIECDPQAFLECSGEGEAIFCDGSGSATRVEACSFGCSEGLAGCNECSPGEEHCVSGDLVSCAADGTIESSTTCELSCLDGAEGEPPRCAYLEPTNLPGDLCAEAAADDEPIEEPINTDTDCDVVVAQNAASDICLIVRDELIVADAEIRVTGARPLALVGTTSVVIDGRIDASADGSQAGPGVSSEWVKAIPETPGPHRALEAAEAGMGRREPLVRRPMTREQVDVAATRSAAMS